MQPLRAFVFLPLLAFAAPAHAQFIDASSGALQDDAAIPVVEVAVPQAPAPEPKQEWVDVARVLNGFRITENVADLRAVTVDATGKEYGFYFASAKKGLFTVYRNGRVMKQGDVESLYDLQQPTIFRMTASGQLLYALHGTDLYVDQKQVSDDGFPFSKGVDSVHDEGGVLTFPEGGAVVRYDIARDKRMTLHKHVGSIEYLRRSGGYVAYALREKGFVRMYKNGRRVSAKPVENPENFAIGKQGEVYFFTKAARGYSLYRDTRSFVTGKGDGAYVAVDPDGHVWHLSYVRLDRRTAISLTKDRAGVNLLPPNVANAELSLSFVEGGYATKASFSDDPSAFFLVRDGKVLGDSFLFEYPYNDLHGMRPWIDSLVTRAYVGGRWTILADGEGVDHASLGRAWFFRVQGETLTIYATK